MAYTIEYCVNEDCGNLTVNGDECTECIDPPVVKRDSGIQRARAFRAGAYENDIAYVGV